MNESRLKVYEQLEVSLQEVSMRSMNENNYYFIKGAQAWEIRRLVFGSIQACMGIYE